MQYNHKQYLAISQATKEAVESETENHISLFPTNFVESVRLSMNLKNSNSELNLRIGALERQLERDAAKVAFYDAVADTNQMFDMDEVGKILGIGKMPLLQKLRESGFLMSNHNRRNRPYQKHINAGRFDLVLTARKNRSTGEVEIKTMPFVTGKGLIFLHNFFNSNFDSNMVI